MLVVPLLLAADLALVVASGVIRGIGGADDEARLRAWLLETDGGWPERFGYAQQVAVGVLLVLLWHRTRRRVWLAWAGLYSVVLADDSLRLHERLGDQLARALELPDGLAGLRGDDLGELTAWGLLAVVPLAVVVRLHRRSDRGTRAASLGLAALACGYAFFGIGVDQLHAAARNGPWELLAGTVEDGGELLALSVTVAYAGTLLGAARRRRPAGEDGGEVEGEAAAGADQSPRASAAASSSPA